MVHAHITHQEVSMETHQAMGAGTVLPGSKRLGLSASGVIPHQGPQDLGLEAR
jgi:hypothetical protein